jgi:threonine dehydrogenase-like Zn-dependent dehydrogenase
LWPLLPLFSGRTNCCENLKVIGVHIDGAMQEVVAHPAHLIHKIPDDVATEMAPLAEPLTIALHALHRAKLTAGEHIAIIGAGAIGLMAALSALRYGATPIPDRYRGRRLSMPNRWASRTLSIRRIRRLLTR